MESVDNVNVFLLLDSASFEQILQGSCIHLAAYTEDKILLEIHLRYIF